jgi:hypothetical protein
VRDQEARLVVDKQGQDEQPNYRIEVQGELDEGWTELFNGMNMTYQNGVTTLTGRVKDQVALRGILTSVWDLNLVLISVQQVECKEGI